MASDESLGVLRVLIVDDHRTFAELLAMALDAQPDIRCVGHVQQAADAAQAVVDLDPDVVLIDVHLGDGDGIALAPALLGRRSGLRLVALTASLDPVNVARAAQAGFCAYLPKAGALDEVLNAVRTAQVGSLLLQPAMVRDLVALSQSPGPGGQAGTARPVVLTAREQQVLGGLAQGLDVNAIARSLGIRTSTCRGYVQNVLTKLGAHTQLEAVVQARRQGLLDGLDADGPPG